MKPSHLEAALLYQIKAAKLPKPETEFRFAPPRRWRFDIAWPESKIAVEIEGGIHIRGRHSRGVGMLADMEKYNAAALDGWTLLRVASDHIGTGKALEWIERALGREAA